MMIKKTLILIALLLTCAVSSIAQSWTVYPLYNGLLHYMLETPSKLYYTSNGSLYSYDKDTQETYAYTNANKLSDAIITQILYNKKYKFLLVIYQDCNMDAIYEDGRVINLPEIYKANLAVEKSINSANMQDEYISIATNFGYVIYDASKLVVKESRNWEKPILAATVWRDHIVVQDDVRTLAAPMESAHSTIGDFTILSTRIPTYNFQVMGDELFAKHRSGNAIYRFTNVDFDAPFTDLSTVISSHARYDWFSPYADGYYIVNNTEVTIFDNEGKQTEVLKLPPALQNFLIAIWKNDKKVWHASLGGEGVGYFDISGSTPVVLHDYYAPEGASCQRVAYIIPSASGKKMYFTTMAEQRNRTCGSGWDAIQSTDVLENGRLSNASINKENTQPEMGGRRYADGMLIPDPDDESIYYLTSRFDGVHVVKDREQITRFSRKMGNAPFDPTDWWGNGYSNSIYAGAFDKNKNLWLLAGNDFTNTTENNPRWSRIWILPADKVKDPKNVKKEDWLSHPIPTTYRNDQECWIIACKHSDYIITESSVYAAGILVIDTKGTSTIDDDRVIHHKSFTDQDNGTYAPTGYMCIAEDQRGMVWIGTQDGVIEIDPSEAWDADFRCNRIKVPRNDGTNYADYLLSGEQVNWISVDPANRKWIATQNSGVYLVSETGDKILEHYTMDNSPLPTNTINVVEASKTDNMVYMGTNYGPIAYSSDASPAAADLSDVYAYPNPVRPDYTGWITIAGLMNNSLVKITDAQGALVYQGKSEGGMMIWDGCNLGGERVRSGVYFVLASENESGSNFSAVTKIMVIN